MIVPESPPVPEAANAEPGDASLVLPFDPRQGTLLGFEFPADALEALTKDGASAESEVRMPANLQADGVTRSNAPVGEMSPAPAEPVLKGNPATEVEPRREDEQATLVDDVAAMATAKTPAAEKPLAGRPATAKKAADGAPMSAASAKPDLPEKPEKPAPLPKAAASRQAARPVAQMKEPAPSPNPASASPARAGLVARGASSEASETAALARTVASMQEALEHERLAGEQRWRRMRNWLAAALVGVAVVLLASIGQTVALVGSAHQAEAARQQALTAVNEQQAALANLASAISALSARMPTPAGQAPAADAAQVNIPQPPAKHAKPARARCLKEKEKEKAAAR